MQIPMGQQMIVVRRKGIYCLFPMKSGLFKADRCENSDDEEDEAAELMRELEKIKKERIEQKEREVCQLDMVSLVTC